MLYVLRMLPWHVDQDDWDEEDFDAWYDGLRYERKLCAWAGKSSHSTDETCDLFRTVKSNTKGQEVLFVSCDNAIAFV